MCKFIILFLAILLPFSAMGEETQNNDLCWNLKINTSMGNGSFFVLMNFSNQFGKTKPIIDNILSNNRMKLNEIE